MRTLSSGALGLIGALALVASACGANTGTPGSSAVTHPAVPGTVFTIVFENHDEGAVISSSAMPYFNQLATTYARAQAYTGTVHPSLPNYIQMVSGSTQGITDDADPASHPIAGADNLGDQLDAAHIPWRAYGQSMGTACKTTPDGTYVPRHMPFLYFTSLTSDAARCNNRVVDFDANFTQDLAANTYRYMWITPDLQSDMHDGTPAQADAWLQRVIPQILASPGYQNGGAIFILFDEGSPGLPYLTGSPQNLATLVISPNLVSPGYISNTSYDHRSYLATVEDIFAMPRLSTTATATPMSEFFATPITTGTTGSTGTNGSNGTSGSTGTTPSGTTNSGTP